MINQPNLHLQLYYDRSLSHIRYVTVYRLHEIISLPSLQLLTTVTVQTRKSLINRKKINQQGTP